MKVTAITSQIKDANRVNIMIDGSYRFSLDITQVIDLGIKIGREYDEAELDRLETESQFGKLYNRALEYCLMRLRSSKEVKDYLYRKTRPSPMKTGGMKPGVSVELTERVYQRLAERNYINDEKFTRFWIENRQVRKGISRRKLQAELRAKGVEGTLIEKCLADSPRDEREELKKVIEKKRRRYDDEQKLMKYLVNAGFSYDIVKQALAEG